MNDPLGHNLLEQRIRDQSRVLQQTQTKLQTITLPKNWDPACPFICTGVGSSEAHARYLVHLINEYTHGNASFRPLREFYYEPLNDPQNYNLIVISQGICPNSLLALKQAKAFASRFLLTAFNPNNNVIDNSKKLAVVEKFLTEGGIIVPFLPEEEYTLLMRVQGPLCGYYAVLRFIEVAFQYSFNINFQALLNTLQEASTHLRTPSLDISQGAQIITFCKEYEYAQNLSSKFLEGIFSPLPPIIDALSYSHGYFQENFIHPRLTILLSGPKTAQTPLMYNVENLLEQAKVPRLHFMSSLPAAVRIIEYEAIFNELILLIIKKYQINQRDWPGKGCDEMLYEVESPLFQ